ncbi:MAG: flagellar basal body-associated protein FliL [Nitratireductor sp.]
MAEIDDLSLEGAPELKVEEEKPQKSGFMTTIIALLLLSGVAIGAGWFVANQNSAPPASVEAEQTDVEKKVAKAMPKKSEGDASAEELEAPSFTRLDPFLLNLPRSDNSLLRLELGLITDDGYNSITNLAEQARLVDEIFTYLKTIKLDMYTGPSGYLHLREDLLERAQFATKGRVKKVLVLSMAVE